MRHASVDGILRRFTRSASHYRAILRLRPIPKAMPVIRCHAGGAQDFTPYPKRLAVASVPVEVLDGPERSAVVPAQLADTLAALEDHSVHLTFTAEMVTAYAGAVRNVEGELIGDTYPNTAGSCPTRTRPPPSRSPAVNREFLLEAIDAGGEDQLMLSLDGPVTPVVIRSPRSLSLLMPVRV